ncbi:MAG: protein translocase subunit SecF [Gemmatimonadaceae bacterium]
MFRILHDTSYDFIKWWRHAAILTAAFIGLGLASFAFTGGVNSSIEFTGGTLMQLEFTTPKDDADLRATLESGGIEGAEIQRFGSNREFTVRAQEHRQIASQAAAAEGVANRIRAVLDQKYGADAYRVVRTEAVGPKVGSELRRGAAIAMVLASFVTLIYLAIRFEWRFAVAAVLSTLHDVLVTVSFIKLFDFEVSLTIVAAILTLLGYSANDTIIIFDRVRENLKKARKEPLYDTLNRSINETLPRSVMTHTTTLAATLVLLVFAGEVIRPFAWVMSFGVFVATFSSIYIASPILLWIERKFPRETADKAQVSAAAARAESTAERRERPKPALR